MIAAIFTEGNKEALAKFTWRTLYIGNMHFQDAYDYDIQRLMRCDIHYSVPDGRIIPFCSYNSGPIYRTEVEKKSRSRSPSGRRRRARPGSSSRPWRRWASTARSSSTPSTTRSGPSRGRPG